MSSALTSSLCWLGVASLMGACASSPSSVDGPSWDAESLIGSMWTEVCPSGDPAQTWIAFYDDGTFAYLYPDASWEYDGDETWALMDGELVVAWNNNYASTRYRVDSSSRLLGTTTKSCPDISLEYVGPAPDLDLTEKGAEPAEGVLQ